MRRHSRATTSWMVGASTSVQHGHTATSLLRRAFVASYSTTSAKALSSKGLWTSSSSMRAPSTSTQPMHASMYAFTTQRRGYVAVGDNFSIKVPPIAESVSSGKLKEWTVKVGDTVAEDQELCHIESDKLEIPVRSPCAGVIVALHASEGDVVDVGKEIVLMTKGNAAAAASVPPTPSAPTHAPPVAASPPKPTTAAAPVVSSTAPVVGDAAAGTRRVRTSAMRLRIADRLKASQNTAAMLTTFNEIDMHNLISLREKHKDEFLKKHGVKLGFMSAFAKASASALQEVPIVNASWEDEHVVYHDYVDISVAVATPTGLVVPVLRNVQSMSFADVEKKIAEFGKKAKDKTITLAEMTGGTFTISNGGVFGSWLGTPIINPPQSAILGVHATKQKPWVAEDGKTIVVRPIMAVALTYDHRLIDGRDAVTFLVKIKNIIEDPQRLLLDL